MAKFNGKKGKHRNLAESVLNAYFNSAGIGTKGSKPVEKSIPKMHLGGAPHGEPHPPQGLGQMDAMNQRFMQYQNGTGQGTEMPFYGQQGFGQTGMQGMQGMPSNRFMPEDLDTKYDIGNSLNNMWQGQNFGAVDTSQDTGLNPGQVPAAMAKFLEEQGKTSLKSTGLASAGSFVKNSEFAQGDKTGSDWATAIGGAAQGYGAAIPIITAVPGVGPFAAAAMAGYSVYDKKNQEYEEGRRLQKERGERSEMVASNALDFSNQVNSMYSDEGNQAGSYYAKYGGAVADLLKKYGHGGTTSNTNYKKYGGGGPSSPVNSLLGVLDQQGRPGHTREGNMSVADQAHMQYIAAAQNRIGSTFNGRDRASLGQDIMTSKMNNGYPQTSQGLYKVEQQDFQGYGPSTDYLSYDSYD